VNYLGELHNIGGLLDIAFMRPSELGYDVIFDRKKTRGLLVAGKKFLLEDLYMLQALKLRPEKAEKDRLRMFTFASKVLGASVSEKNSLKTIFMKTLSKARPDIIGFENRPYFHRDKLLRLALSVKVAKYPSNPTHKKLGCPSNKGVPTRSRFAFSSREKKWVPINTNMYIRNEANFRLKNSNACKKTLYGFNPVRNASVPKKLIAKAMAIG